MACAMISASSQDLISLHVRCSELAVALAAGGWTRHKGDVEASMCGMIYLFLGENLPHRQMGGSKKKKEKQKTKAAALQTSTDLVSCIFDSRQRVVKRIFSSQCKK